MFLNKEIHVLPILYCSSRAFVYMTVPNFDCFVMLLIVSDMTVCCSHCIGDHWIALVIKAQNKLYLLAAVHIGLKKCLCIYLHRHIFQFEFVWHQLHFEKIGSLFYMYITERFHVNMNVSSEPCDSKLQDRNTQEYTSFSNRFSGSIRKSLGDPPGLRIDIVSIV